MKLVALTLLILFVTGCASTPRVGDVSGADYAVEVKTGSSKGLQALHATPIKGVRDLSLDEYKALEADVQKFKSVSESVEGKGIDSNTYAVASTAVGSSLGLAFDYAAGIAILGRLAADDREFNYEFSDDYNSTAKLYSPLSSADLLKELSVKIPIAMNSFNKIANIRYGIEIDDNPIIVTAKAGDRGNRSGLDVYEYVGVVSKKIDGRKVSSKFHFAALCQPGISKDAVCDVKIRFLVDRKENPAVSLLAGEISSALSDDTLLYMPPRKDLYQLPMVYAGKSEPYFLVENM